MVKMHPKHYAGFQQTFPELDVKDYEALFAAGFITPGHVKKAKEADLKKVISAAKAKKIKDKWPG